jgi:hypothetical protein
VPLWSSNHKPTISFSRCRALRGRTRPAGESQARLARVRQRTSRHTFLGTPRSGLPYLERHFLARKLRYVCSKANLILLEAFAKNLLVSYQSVLESPSPMGGWVADGSLHAKKQHLDPVSASRRRPGPLSRGAACATVHVYTRLCGHPL